MTLTPTEQAVLELLGPILADLRIDLYDVELAGGVLRILLDRPGGVDMGAITDATRRISRALDDVDPISGSYTLEVSSPGIERNLRIPAHFAGAVGERVKVKTRPDQGLDRRIGGVLESFDDPRFAVRTDDGDLVVLSLDQAERVRTQFVDTAAPKPGKGPKGGSKGRSSARSASAKAVDAKTSDSTTAGDTDPSSGSDQEHPNSKTRSETSS